MARPARRGAFTLIEVLLVISIISLLLGILLPSLGGARRAARQAICQSHLSQLAVAHAGYWADFKERVASFTWEPGKSYSRYPDLNNAPTWTTAAANQAVDILRRRADREDLPPIGNRLPHRHYSHLILNDYMSAVLPEKIMACPEDRNLLSWQADPRNLNPQPNDWATPFGRLWGYSSTYQIIPAAWSFDTSGPGGATVSQYTEDHNLFWVGSRPWGKRRMSEVQFPANKTLVFEYFDRHNGKQHLYYAYEQAIPTLMFWDGHVRSHRTGDANRGFLPNSPSAAQPTIFKYIPGILGVEPPTLSGAAFDIVTGYHRWTRGGLEGVDYGATEINTGQP